MGEEALLTWGGAGDLNLRLPREVLITIVVVAATEQVRLLLCETVHRLSADAFILASLIIP